MSVTLTRSATMAQAPELVVRQVLLEQVRTLVADEELQGMLFGRADDLEQGSQNDWAREMMSAFQQLAPRIKAMVSYPPDEADLPLYSVVVTDGSEDTAVSHVGDTIRRTSEMVGTWSATSDEATKVYDHIEKGVGWSCTAQIGSWSVRPEESLLMHSIAKWAMFQGKNGLTRMGAMDVGLSESGLSPDGSGRYPHVAWVPMVMVRLNWTYSYRIKTGPQPHRVRVRSSVFSIPT